MRRRAFIAALGSAAASANNGARAAGRPGARLATPHVLEGRGRRRHDRPVHPWDRGTGRPDHSTAVVGRALEQRRFDGVVLLRQVPAITELSQLDATGHEQLRVSRLPMDVVGSQTDYSQDPKFTEAVAHKVYYGPVYFPAQAGPIIPASPI